MTPMSNWHDTLGELMLISGIGGMLLPSSVHCVAVIANADAELFSFITLVIIIIINISETSELRLLVLFPKTNIVYFNN